jgi:GT2 family glycosyltransferase
MDEFPAGPASPGRRRPCLAVVIPVYNGGADFQRCLRALRDAAEAISGPIELIAIDDGSTDGSGELAAAFGARVLRHEKPLGPAAARNLGAKEATAEVVFFLDADVLVHPATLSGALGHLERHPEVAAVFGSYDDSPPAPGLVSRYRNLLHHHVHQQGEFDGEQARAAHTFWTGCGAIRREAFLEAGGFDPELYPRPAIEDIELGYRLTRAGHAIHLKRDLFATHLKRWTLGGVIRTDIFHRGVPWLLLQWRLGVRETDLNVGRTQKLCALGVGLGGLALPASVAFPPLLASVPAALLLIVAANRPFYRLLAHRRGLPFAAAATLPHAVYYACCLASVIIAAGRWSVRSRRPLAPAATPRRAPRPHGPGRNAPHARAHSDLESRPDRRARP